MNITLWYDALVANRDSNTFYFDQVNTILFVPLINGSLHRLKLLKYKPIKLRLNNSQRTAYQPVCRLAGVARTW